MRPTPLHVFLSAAACALLATSAAAQQPGAMPSRCRVVPDTAALIPRPAQVAERNELRDSLLAVAARHVAEPKGLLFVLVDSLNRTGRVLYLQTNLPEAAVHQSTRRMETYVSSLPPGRGYQALVRVERPYAPLRAGLVHCHPELKSAQELSEMTALVSRAHPHAGTPRSPGRLTAYLRLVVDHEGNVAYVDMERPTGDAYLDKMTPDLAVLLKFEPPTLDGVPFDARIRFPVTYDVR
jgi:TonB family protein